MMATILLLMFLIGPLLMVVTRYERFSDDWKAASHAPTGQAPDPAVTPEAVVHVYAAQAFSWRGVFSVHSWLAVKEKDAKGYDRYEVIGWNKFRGLPALMIGDHYWADGLWYGEMPTLLFEARGEKAEKIIAKLPEAAETYSWPNDYRAFPGPNSNSFTAHVLREVPEIDIALPPNALGKDYLPGLFVGKAPSGQGLTVSVFGLLGMTVGAKEGVEFSLAGMTIGVSFKPFGLVLPAIGRVTF